MKRIRNSLGIGAGRMTNRAMRVLGRNSTALPGYIAERIAQEPLRHYLKGRTFAKTILVTGTNGKTTTTMLIAGILRDVGYEVVNNSSGSNLTRGVLTALLADARQGENAILLLEVDEASMPAVCNAVKADIIVVSNIFRDQLDRYGEVDTTRRLLKGALDLAPNAELVLCADDPHVVLLAEGARGDVSYFGIDIKGLKALRHDHASDTPLSPTTQSPLRYSQRYFGHIGKYEAVDGSFSRPKPSVSATDSIEKLESQVVTVKVEGVEKLVTIQSSLLGVYNIYNLLATISTTLACGVAIKDIIRSLQKKTTAFGRQESVHYRGKLCTFLLVKNPTGFNQVIQSFFQKAQEVPILVVINDNFADGRDVSWLWDVAIEDMHTVGRVVVSGTRAYDMALRLSYAGRQCDVIRDPIEALTELTHENSDRIYILPTYTALLKMRDQLSLKLEHNA